MLYLLDHLQVSVCQHVQSLHTTCQLLAAEKALLMKLRKSTGYTFINCKKALEKFDNDIAQVMPFLHLCLPFQFEEQQYIYSFGDC